MWVRLNVSLCGEVIGRKNWRSLKSSKKTSFAVAPYGHSCYGVNCGNSNFSVRNPNKDFAGDGVTSQNIFPCDDRPGNLNSVENNHSWGNIGVEKHSGFFLKVTKFFSAGQNFLHCGHSSRHMAVQEIQ